jgi:hypothetical protein
MNLKYEFRPEFKLETFAVKLINDQKKKKKS